MRSRGYEREKKIRNIYKILYTPRPSPPAKPICLTHQKTTTNKYVALKTVFKFPSVVVWCRTSDDYIFHFRYERARLAAENGTPVKLASLPWRSYSREKTERAIDER